MRKFQCLLCVEAIVYFLLYYIICMTVPLMEYQARVSLKLFKLKRTFMKQCLM